MDTKILYLVLREFLLNKEGQIQTEIESVTKEYADNPETDEEEIRDGTYGDFPDQRQIGFLLGQRHTLDELRSDLENFYDSYTCLHQKEEVF